jgi:hypothetical protein
VRKNCTEAALRVVAGANRRIAKERARFERKRDLRRLFFNKAATPMEY